MKTNQFICDICGGTVTPSTWEFYPSTIKIDISHPSTWTPKWDDVCKFCCDSITKVVNLKISEIKQNKKEKSV